MKNLRKIWTPNIERDDDGFLNGCLPQDDFDLEMVETLEAASVSFSTAYMSGDMPIIKWDTDFETFIDRRGNQIEEMMREGTRCIFPWRVEAYLPEEYRGRIDSSLYFSQGSKPSCMGHADDFAYRSSLLMQIGLGAPLIYETTNPYITWFLSKDRSERGGQSPGPMAKAANEYGHYLTGEVGNTNTAVARNYMTYTESAKRHQSGILFIPGNVQEVADRIRRVNRAGLGVALGNSTAVNGATIDSNNVQIATLGGSWAHATSFNAWMIRNNQEYVFWTNSHGKKYQKSTFGEPADGAWMRTDKELVNFLQTASRYGQPYVVLPESTWIRSERLRYDFGVPFPKGFKV